MRDGIFWGGDFELALRLLRKGLIERSRIRFFIGYSGWTEGQLDTELREKSWLVTPGSRKIVFPKSEIETWKESLRDMGGDYEILVNFPIDPSMN